MDTKKPAVDRILESLSPLLAAELERSVNEAQREQQEQFSKKLQQAIEETQAAADRASAELHQQLGDRAERAESTWAEERTRLESEVRYWRTLAEAPQALSEGASQSDLLWRFLGLAEPFSKSVAVYVMKGDGLSLWKRRGGVFPDFASQDTIDPEWFFLPVVVRDRTVAAVCAHQPFRRDALEFLASTLGRAIELFGVRMQSAALRPRGVEDSMAARN